MHRPSAMRETTFSVKCNGPHGEERAHQGHRDGDEHDERRPPAAEKEEEDQRGGDDALHEIQPGLVEGGVDEDGGVAGNREAVPGEGSAAARSAPP